MNHVSHILMHLLGATPKPAPALIGLVAPGTVPPPMPPLAVGTVVEAALVLYYRGDQLCYSPTCATSNKPFVCTRGLYRIAISYIGMTVTDRSQDTAWTLVGSDRVPSLVYIAIYVCVRPERLFNALYDPDVALITGPQRGGAQRNSTPRARHRAASCGQLAHRSADVRCDALSRASAAAMPMPHARSSLQRRLLAPEACLARRLLIGGCECERQLEPGVVPPART